MIKVFKFKLSSLDKELEKITSNYKYKSHKLKEFSGDKSNSSNQNNQNNENNHGSEKRNEEYNSENEENDEDSLYNNYYETKHKRRVNERKKKFLRSSTLLNKLKENEEEIIKEDLDKDLENRINENLTKTIKKSRIILKPSVSSSSTSNGVFKISKTENSKEEVLKELVNEVKDDNHIKMLQNMGIDISYYK